ncbi:hypothetical protein ACEWY4_008644 [Coilia grayii]|uniref:Serpin domain-containing protein n=1 Tax=Coilia grayii TaxID=363190 RepID=A0ABD1KBU8_9TELE
METHGETELLECRLCTEDLVKLQGLFLPVGDLGEEGSLGREEGSLGREEFAERAWAAVGRGTPEEYGRLFDSVDVSREGRLDWTRLTTFLLLKLCEQDEQARAATVPRWRAPRSLPSPHREPVQGVVLLPNPSRYLSLSRDGVLGVWGEDLGLLRSLRLANDTVKPKDLWATAVVVLPNVHKVAVAFTSKEICFYDLLSKQEFSCQYKVQGLTHTPIALHYWFNPEDPDQAALSVGDVGGKVSVMCFRTALISLFERPSSGPVEQDATTVIQWAELTEGQHSSCCYIATHSAHGHSWVRRVRFLGPLEAVVSCTWSCPGSLVLAWRETKGLPLRLTHFNTHTGISDLDYHPTTAGLNNHVYLWNPYVTSKPVGVLRGHMNSVVAVQFVLGKRQLLSFSKDKVLRLWDVSSQLCIQRVSGVFPKSQECQTLLLFREEHSRLLLSFNAQLLLLEARKEPGRRVTSHESPVTCVLYNTLFRQVGAVWSRGQKVKQFTRCHGDAEISTMALDGTQTRLFTAGTDGIVKVWDFNGHCHHRLNAGRDRAAEISQVLVLKRTVLVLGWERIITVFRPAVFSKFFVQPSEWQGGVQHRDDVLCAAFRPPQTLVTGSYDGEITVWNNSTENALRKLRPDGQRGLRSKSDGAALRANQSATPDRPSAPSDSSLPPAGQGGPEDCHAITKLFFLERHKGVTAAGGADLVSCGTSGLVRFWNTTHCSLVAEFVAHRRSGSIILTVGGGGRYLVTADVHGGVKVWDVQVSLSEKETLHMATTAFCPVMECSDDPSAPDQPATPPGLCHAPGDLCPWRPALPLVHFHRLHRGLSYLPRALCGHILTCEEVILAEEKDHFLEVGGAEKSGCVAVAARLAEPGRAPKATDRRPHANARLLACSSVGTFSELALTELESVEDLDKPDFVSNPHLYFGRMWDSTTPTPPPPTPPKPPTLKASFDERSLFPKEVLQRVEGPGLAGRSQLARGAKRNAGHGHSRSGQPRQLPCLGLLPPAVARYPVCGFLPQAMLVLLTLLSLGGVATANPAGPITDTSSALALNLFRAVSAAAPDDNVVLCPLGMIQMLAQVQLGARGSTLQQLRKAMHPVDIRNETSLLLLQKEAEAILSPQQQGSEEQAFHVSMANALFLQEGFPLTEEYLQASTAHLHTSLRHVDFFHSYQAAHDINTWVESQTNGKIQQLFSGDDFGPLSRLAVASAVYFRGSWQQGFPPENTEMRPFTRADGSITDVPMMYHRLQANIGSFPNGADEVHVLDLSYGEEEASLIVLLPGSAEGLPQLERDLSLELLNTWITQTQQEEVEVLLPKFRVSQRVDLEKALRSMNITELFDPGCDLSGMSEAGQLHISKAVQSTFIEVNEEGTEAAAATGGAAAVIMSLQSHRFTADRPFLFLIRHRLTGAVLFAGRVLQPELTESRGRDTQAL